MPDTHQNHDDLGQQSIPQVDIIRPSLFQTDPRIVCGMSTRCGGLSKGSFGMNLSHSIGDDESDVKRNRARFFGSMNIQLEQLAIPRQVHGDIVRYVHEPGTYESCDGLTTDCPRVFLVVSVADCLPIVLVDPRKRAIAAVHAGWRGSESMVVLKAMRLMKDQYGTRADELLAYIGPAAGVCCYEVGPEVESRFDERYLHRTAQLKAHLDLKAFNKDLLVSSGVGKLHIEVSNLCTICNPKLLHSYRRDRINSGRMMCVVGLTD